MSYITINTKLGIGFIIYGCFIYSIICIIVLSKSKVEEFMVIFFALSVPFLNDINIFKYQNDFHVVSNTYFTFNILHIITILLFVEILKNKNKISINIDIIFLFIFNMICIISIFNAINFEAAFFDYIRYFNLSIIYIYFSRIFNCEKYSNMLIKYFIIGLIIQLIWGIIQKIIGGPIGLSFLGEKSDVFRLGVVGYEKGMSGTFGHPGPYALYSVIILPWILFNNKLNANMRNLGIITSTLIIVLAAGRTSIALMIIVYLIFFIEKILNINTKTIITTFIVIGFTILGVLIFNEQIQVVINRFTTSDMNSQVENRLEHIEIASYYIKQRPLLGFGINNYLDLTNRDFPFEFHYNFFLNNPIHNLYLLYAVEIGLIGASIFIIFLINNFRYLLKSLRCKERNVVQYMKGYSISLIVYIIYNLQGWGGIQNRSLILIILASALIFNNYLMLNKQE